MKRPELEHVRRAPAAITKSQSFVVIGSQAVLLPFFDAPAELLTSNEVDRYLATYPERVDPIDGAIGHLSMSPDTFGHHADGFGPDAATMLND